MGAMAVAVRPLSGADLPPEAIEQILALLDPVDRAWAASTCKAWRRVDTGSKLLYGDLTLAGHDLGPNDEASSASSIRQWIAARLEAIQHFKMWNTYPFESVASSVVDMLASANKLMTLQYVGGDTRLSSFLNSVARLTTLRSLHISAPAGSPAANLVLRARDISKLKPLRNLRAIRINVAEIRGGLPPALLRAWSRLEQLSVSSRATLAAGGLRHLTSLRTLELEGVELEPPPRDVASRLTALTSLALTPRPGGGGSWSDLELWSSLPFLPRLVSLATHVGVPLPSALAPGGGHPGHPGLAGGATMGAEDTESDDDDEDDDDDSSGSDEEEDDVSDHESDDEGPLDDDEAALGGEGSDGARALREAPGAPALLSAPFSAAASAPAPAPAPAPVSAPSHASAASPASPHAWSDSHPEPGEAAAELLPRYEPLSSSLLVLPPSLVPSLTSLTTVSASLSHVASLPTFQDISGQGDEEQGGEHASPEASHEASALEASALEASALEARREARRAARREARHEARRAARREARRAARAARAAAERLERGLGLGEESGLASPPSPLSAPDATLRTPLGTLSISEPSAVLGVVPPAILACAGLESLVLPWAVSRLPDLAPGQLSRLTALALPDSQAPAWPDSWSRHLSALRALALNGARRMAPRLPPSLAQLRQLRALELRLCGLKRLPGSVAALPRLRALDLGGNRLRELPDGRYLASLEYLSLRGNRLAAPPPALGRAAMLRDLDLGENDPMRLCGLAATLGEMARRKVALVQAPADGLLWTPGAEGGAPGRVAGPGADARDDDDDDDDGDDAFSAPSSPRPVVPLSRLVLSRSPGLGPWSGEDAAEIAAAIPVAPAAALVFIRPPEQHV